MTWRDDAACSPSRIPSDTSHDDFFPMFYEGKAARKAGEARALAVCDKCTVRVPCLTEELGFPVVVGIRGGQRLTTDRSRREARQALREGRV